MKSLINKVNYDIRDKVFNQICKQDFFLRQVRAQIWRPVRIEVWDQVTSQVYEQIRNQL